MPKTMLLVLMMANYVHGNVDYAPEAHAKHCQTGLEPPLRAPVPLLHRSEGNEAGYLERKGGDTGRCKMVGKCTRSSVEGQRNESGTGRGKTRQNLGVLPYEPPQPGFWEAEFFLPGPLQDSLFNHRTLFRQLCCDSRTGTYILKHEAARPNCYRPYALIERLGRRYCKGFDARAINGPGFVMIC
ncbi:hypothetical protein WG66_005906 [Moniliophthora roreri]|nr:hypothetical protein WG66_005906 [Moniliophthora roreri]